MVDEPPLEKPKRVRKKKEVPVEEMTEMQRRLHYAKDENPPEKIVVPRRASTERELALEAKHNRVLTEKQKAFARFFVEGLYTNTECARRAGFAYNTSAERASAFLDGKSYPHVTEYIAELREERERKYGVTLMGQLHRLHQLSRGAEDAGQFSAAINAEKLRSALGGLTTDRRETINTLDQLSREEIVSRLAALQSKYPQAFSVIEGSAKEMRHGQRTGGKLLDITPPESADD